MKCVKCGRLDPDLVLGTCSPCIVAEQSTELEKLRERLATVEEHVRAAYGINPHAPGAIRIIEGELRGAIAAIEGKAKP